METTAIHHQWTYDVFVSFRGEDIRKSFIDHLFNDFKRKGIVAFRDDTHLPRGEWISSQLYRAIESSRFLIVIFSKNYASSSWCLRELVKILECKQMVNPTYQVQTVFYDVKPGVVRHQTGSYAEAFAKHESSKKKEVFEWKAALTMAADLSGWDLQDMANGYESKFIDMISNDILLKLCHGPLHVGENLVGIDASVTKMNISRFIGSTKVHMIGICGIGGIGKTTLAKVIYNLMHAHFEACSFCDDIQGVATQRGLVQVLIQLIDDIIKSRDLVISSVGQGTRVMKERLAAKRVLIVLDGIDRREQLEALAGSRSWFFPGSLIVFTSKDRQLLNAHEVDEIYDVDFLNKVESLKLFSMYAFRKEFPTEDFEELADRVVRYVQGHPLALKVLGCFLYGKTVREWESEIDKLQVYPIAEIQQVLRLSFDGLDETQKKVFLDIACSLKGEKMDLAIDVLNSCNAFGDTNIRVLVDRSLVTISSTMLLEMHDLIQRMAWEIIHNESERPGKRSRLWIPEEVSDVLQNDEATDTVEVLVLLHLSSQKAQTIDQAFSRMNKLRILKIFCLKLDGGKVGISGSIRFLSNELRLLSWHGYPFRFLPSSFYPKNIVVIDMSNSHIKNLWITPKNFYYLKVMKLRNCRHLENTPDFTGIKNLEELTLEGCVKLVEVHPSVGTLKRLIVLNLENCSRLKNLPCNLETESLQILIISGCSKMDQLPKALGSQKTLVELHANQTAIKEIPYSVSSLSNLRVLQFGGCGEIQSRWQISNFWHSLLLRKLQRPPSLVLPSLLGLRLLRRLDVSHCNISEVSPDSVGGLSCLEFLNLSGNNFSSLPASLSELSKLTILALVGCPKLEVLPDIPTNIINLDASDCTSLRELKMQRQQVTNERRVLDFTNCSKLVENHTIESLVSMLLPQSFNHLLNHFDILVQGSRIPRWFTNQSPGDCVEVKLPTHWCNDKYVQFGVCVVFLAKVSPSSVFHCALKVSIFPDQVIDFSFRIKTFTGLDMMWIRYSKFRPGSEDANTFITFSFMSTDIEVKKCGVRLIFNEGISDSEASNLSMIEGIPTPTPTQDGVVFDSNKNRISEITEDEPPPKRNRTM